MSTALEKGNNRRLQQYFGPGRAPDGQAGLRERQLLSYWVCAAHDVYDPVRLHRRQCLGYSLIGRRLAPMCKTL